MSSFLSFFLSLFFIRIVAYATMNLSNYVLQNLQYMYKVSNSDNYKVVILKR
jgi:hypothetical protein